MAHQDSGGVKPKQTVGAADEGTRLSRMEEWGAQ